MTFAVDPEGAAYAYGWQGPRSPVFIRTPVEIGRLTRGGPPAVFALQRLIQLAKARVVWNSRRAG